jgi:cob(I)alamin adenosyltransferase
MEIKKQKPVGLFMIHAGAGKGKTTAAVGTAVRASGSGMNVFIIQFIKGEWPSGEKDFIQEFEKSRQKNKSPKFGRIDFVQGGKGFIKILGDKKPFSVHQKAAADTLKKAKLAMKSGKYDLIVMDEAISAIEEKLLKVKDLIDFIKLRPKKVHVIMTGHVIPKQLASKADLISEVKMIKHPYYKGILAQRGIDF